jgi:NitT/TauT family transport system permease protein
MQRVILPQKFSPADLLILMLIATMIYALVSTGIQWRAVYHPVTNIDLSIRSLPYYTMLSGVRGLVAYMISLLFTIVVGYAAAKNRTAEKILIPMIDILQSIPVLGFLPVVTLSLVAVFPHSNFGLELAAILMIFTGQVWNMTLSFYSSIKSVPSDFKEASTVIGLSKIQTLLHVELPFSAVNLVWNSLLSLAGGWFFLSACESGAMGALQFQLPGIGSYMQVAINQWNIPAMISGVVAMIVLIVTIDFVISRPILAWVQRFRLEEVPGTAPQEPLMQIVFRQSRIIRWIKVAFRRAELQRKLHEAGDRQGQNDLSGQFSASTGPLSSPRAIIQELGKQRSALGAAVNRFFQSKAFTVILMTALGLLLLIGSWKLVRFLSDVGLSTWVILIRNTFWTFVRVVASIIVSTIWTVPAGIWMAMSSKRVRFFQPIIQVFASFPAPMLYPLAIIVFFKMGFRFEIVSGLLMFLGVQWYVLFNVLAGALRIPQELKYALDLMESSRWDVWTTLYIPSIFPALVTGWITAAGGAWNASILAEYMRFEGGLLKTSGLGATISAATEAGDFKLMAASLTLMVAVVVILNRSLWAKLYRSAQTRYRMDLA